MDWLWSLRLGSQNAGAGANAILLDSYIVCNDDKWPKSLAVPRPSRKWRRLVLHQHLQEEADQLTHQHLVEANSISS